MQKYSIAPNPLYLTTSQKGRKRRLLLEETDIGKVTPLTERLRIFNLVGQKNVPSLDPSAVPSSLGAAKVCGFRDRSGNDCGVKFTFKDVVDKFGVETECYLTGVKINLYEPRTYEFDHIVPRSKGGSNELSNLGILSKAANQAKSNLSVDEFLSLCEAVLKYSGRI